MINCSVPNLSEYFTGSGHYIDHVYPPAVKERIQKLLKTRIRGILQVALQCNIHILVLGAFDREVFPYSPNMTAEIYHDVLQEFTYSFHEIEFAIHSTPADQKIYEILSSILLPER